MIVIMIVIKTIILPLILLFTTTVYGVSFSEALNSLEKHESIEAIIGKSKAMVEEARLRGSWGDPQFKLAAKNFPENSLKKDQTPMTGLEFGVAQKISLTTKYGTLEDAMTSLSKAYNYEAKDKKEALTKALWEILILKRKISEELVILNENQAWITKILKVSKKLYANGKTNQQAILDIQIRNSEIESEISNKKYELSQIKDNLFYLVGNEQIDESSVPWEILNEKTNKIIDYRELGLKEELKSKELSLAAARLNYIPDLTLSVGITKRSNIDGNGDFLGASISFPLPFSGEKYSMHGKAVEEKYIAVKNYGNYKKNKRRDISILEKEIKKIMNEINIIKNKTIKFATNSRLITSKSYGHGSSSYVELLQSELKLQKIIMNKIMLESTRDFKKATLKYLLGEPLHE